MRKKRVPLDCQRCGACCVSVLDEQGYCDLEPTDLRRLSPEFIAANVLTSDDEVELRDSNGRPFYAMIKVKKQRMRAGPFAGNSLSLCAALEGDVLHNVRCTIYEQRPRACRRAIKSGDKACLRLRAGFLRMAEEVK